MHQVRNSRHLGSTLAGGATVILAALLVGVACSTTATSSAPANDTPGTSTSARGVGDAGQAVQAGVPHSEPPASQGPLSAAATAIPQQRVFTTPFAVRAVAGVAADAPSSDLASWPERRAYDGAPPVIPHSADFGKGTTSCVDCHLQGMRLGQRVARPMSHPVLLACEQCHVEAAHSWLEATPAPENEFVGRALPAARDTNKVSATGAPPTIPHALWMRGNCLACHGAFGFTELQTSHPERANCVQCHVSRRGVPE